MNGLPHVEPEAAAAALADIDRATKLTPFDPNLFLLRSLVRIGAEGDSTGGVEDLSAALELDARNAKAVAILNRITTIGAERGLEILTGGRPFEAAAMRQLNTLQDRF